MHQPAGDLLELASAPTFDHLHDVQVGPRKMTGTSPSTGVQRGVEDFEDGLGIGRESIDGKEHSLGEGTGGLTDSCHHPFDERTISMPRHFPRGTDARTHSSPWPMTVINQIG